jgi:hypothetical protein
MRAAGKLPFLATHSRTTRMSAWREFGLGLAANLGTHPGHIRLVPK